MTTHQRRFSVALLLAALTMLALAGCDQHTNKISDIVSDPGHYAGKDVTVAGEVTQRYELPLGLANVAAYRVSDGTSQIWVLSRAGAPVVGDKVGLRGTVREEGSLGHMAFGSVIEEKGRKIQ